MLDKITASDKIAILFLVSLAAASRLECLVTKAASLTIIADIPPFMDDLLHGKPATGDAAHDLAVGHDRASIQQFAPELLGEIFLYCIPSSPEPISYQIPPLSLLHVCHYWRDVAKGTPRLWQDVHMGRKFKLDPCAIFRTWLDYSASLPLRVIFHINKRDDPEAETKIMDLILDNLHRVSKLNGQFPHWFATYLYSRRDRLPLHGPLLTEMGIGGWDKLPEPTDVALRKLEGCFVVPRLEVLKLYGPRYQLSLLKINPACLRELHGLYVMEVAMVVSMDVLSTFTNLKRLSFFLYGIPNPEALLIPERISIPSLEYLGVSSFPGYDPEVFLSALHVPNIEELTIGSSPKGQVAVGLLLPTLTKNNTWSQLKKLILFGYEAEASEYIPWFTKFSQLETLEFHHCLLDAGTISLLTSSQSTPSLCPCLSTVVFEWSEIPWKEIIRFVESRALANLNIATSEGMTVLRTVKFDSCPSPADEQRSQLLRLRDGSSGALDIIIKDKDQNENRDYYREP